MASRTWKPAAAPLVLVPAALGAVLTLSGQVLSWGLIGDAQSVPVLLRVIAIAGAVAASALCAPSVVADRVGDRATATATVVLGAGTLWWLLELLSAQIVSRVGSWFAVVGAASVVVSGVAALVTSVVASASRPTRRLVGIAATLGVLMVAATTVGGVVWPDRAIESTTAQRLTARGPAGTARVLWTRAAGPDSDVSHYLGVFGGRPVLSDLREIGDADHDGSDVTCRAGLQALDPATGRVAWAYSRPSECEDISLEVDAASDVVRLRYVTDHVAPSTTVYLDPATGEVLHPGGDDDDVTTWVGSYGVIGATLRGFAPTVRVVDARTGRTVFTGAAPTCPGSTPQLADTVDNPANMSGFAVTASGRIAIVYDCAGGGGGGGGGDPDMPRMAVLGPSGVRSVALPPDYLQGTTQLPIVASGDLVAVRYGVTGSAQTVVAAVDTASMTVRWATYLPSTLTVDTQLSSAGGVLISHHVELDAATGAQHHPSGSTVVRGDDGCATPSGNWIEATAESGTVTTTTLTTATDRAVTTELTVPSLSGYSGALQVGCTADGVVLAGSSGTGVTLVALGA